MSMFDRNVKQSFGSSCQKVQRKPGALVMTTFLGRLGWKGRGADQDFWTGLNESLSWSEVFVCGVAHRASRGNSAIDRRNLELGRRSGRYRRVGA